MIDSAPFFRDPCSRAGAAALVAATLFVGLLCLFPLTSFDVWWHLRTGRLILEQGSVPTTDSFTFTAAGRPWITHEWLFEVLISILHGIGGAKLLVGIKALLAAAAVFLGAMAALVGERPASRLPAAAIGVFLAAPMIAARAFVRPHMATALLLGAVLLLLRLESVDGRRWCRWLLIPIFMLWSNLHSGFVLGLGLVTLSWVGEIVASSFGACTQPVRVWRERLIVLGLCFMATLVNPHGIEAFLYPFRLVSRFEVRSSIVELRSVFHPAFRGALFLDALALTAVALLILLFIARRRLVWPLLVPGAVFAGLALISLRGVSEFSVLVPAIIGVHGGVLGSRRRIALATSFIVIALAITGGAAVVTWGQPMGEDGNRRLGLGIHPSNWPGAATRFLASTEPAGETFNLLSFGGAMIHELWPSRRVFIDGRLDVFPTGFLADYARLLETGDGWDEVVAEYDIGTALVDYHSQPDLDRGLRSRLRNDPQWTCVFFSDNTIVYARTRADNLALLESFGSPFDPSLRSAESLETFIANASIPEREQAIRAITAIADFTPANSTPSFVLGQLLVADGRAGAAITPLRRAVAADPSSRAIRNALVQSLCATGQHGEEALEQAVAAARLNPATVEPLMLLADAEAAAGRLPEAARAFEEALIIQPETFLAHLRLGVILARMNRLEEARPHFEEAVRLRPGDKAAVQNLRALQSITGK